MSETEEKPWLGVEHVFSMKLTVRFLSVGLEPSDQRNSQTHIEVLPTHISSFPIFITICMTRCLYD